MTDELLSAFKNLRFVSVEMLMPGVWRLSPGGDLYTYEGPTSLIDEFRDAVAECDRIMIEEGVDP